MRKKSALSGECEVSEVAWRASKSWWGLVGYYGLYLVSLAGFVMAFNGFINIGIVACLVGLVGARLLRLFVRREVRVNEWRVGTYRDGRDIFQVSLSTLVEATVEGNKLHLVDTAKHKMDIELGRGGEDLLARGLARSRGVGAEVIEKVRSSGRA